MSVGADLESLHKLFSGHSVLVVFVKRPEEVHRSDALITEVLDEELERVTTQHYMHGRKSHHKAEWSKWMTEMCAVYRPILESIVK